MGIIGQKDPGLTGSTELHSQATPVSVMQEASGVDSPQELHRRLHLQLLRRRTKRMTPAVKSDETTAGAEVTFNSVNITEAA
ncbi:unnamed protein product [Tetraodon nigroviridis]|uniref:(spotted green pufferfish) hypothetical protein n=1 Tax=Tetraodon nigroviridis TaxID=99883 RepID=Q4S7U8_TETNG|nr:unnamed protein product [Tetraodon nigroviridis]